MKQIIVYSVIIAILIVTTTYFSTLFAFTIFGFKPNYVCNETFIIEYPDEIDDLTFTKELIKRLSKSNNHTEEYNCINFSNDLTLISNKLNLSIESFRGYNNTNGHRWNIIHVEPQNGKLIDYKDIFSLDREILKN